MLWSVDYQVIYCDYSYNYNYKRGVLISMVTVANTDQFQ